jgi:hypothetical protein
VHSYDREPLELDFDVLLVARLAASLTLTAEPRPTCPRPARFAYSAGHPQNPPRCPALTSAGIAFATSEKRGVTRHLGRRGAVIRSPGSVACAQAR